MATLAFSVFSFQFSVSIMTTPFYCPTKFTLDKAHILGKSHASNRCLSTPAITFIAGDI